jgi:ERCC4-related helicase
VNDRLTAGGTAPPWPPGATVRIRERTWRVRRALRDRTIVRLDVENRSGRRTFLAPFDRPSLVGHAPPLRRARPRHVLARLAGLIGRAESIRSLSGVIDSRLDILPFQLEPALAIAAGTRRVLIADEVGLGKTIQAAMVIAEIQRREASARILLIVPAPVRAQWIEELSTRFNLTCFTADRAGLEAAARDAAWSQNPWSRHGIWLASIDFLKQPHVLEALPPAPWDLVVIDEAHAICGHSDRHAAADALARRSRRLLLLSATPHSGDGDRFVRLQELGALQIPADSLSILRRTRLDLSVQQTRRVRWRRIALAEVERRALDALAAYEQAVLKHAAHDRRDAALLLLSVFRKRALSTLHALAISIERRLAWCLGRVGTADWQQPRLEFDADSAAGDDDVGDAEWQSLGADIGMNRSAELAWLRRLLGLAQAATRHESKVAAIARLICRSREPVIVFTEFRDSLQALQRKLSRRHDIAVLHGGQMTAEAAAELSRFTRGRAAVLLATDVAAQGLNLQMRSRWVISFELPWNPMRLEQRIGRVDRIGQRRATHLTVLVARHPAETGLLANLARRTLTARRALGDDVFPAIPDEKQIIAALLIPELSPQPGLDCIGPAVQQRPTVCRAWVKPACAEARRLIRRRALARYWRTPASDLQRPVWSAGRGLCTLCGSRTLVVMIVPLIDRRGAVVEERIVPLCVNDRADLVRDWRKQRRAWQDRAVQASLARAARLTRWRTARVTAEIAIERAIAATLTADCARVDQPGLFDLRADRARADAEAARNRIARDLRERIAGHQSGTVIRPGEPVLAAIITPGT